MYPKATNTEFAALIASLPQTDLSGLKTTLWWNQKCRIESNEVMVLGLFPPGMHVFSEGNYATNGPSMAPVGGGAPSGSGWVGIQGRVTPARVQQWHGHNTPAPTIYIRAPDLREPNRLAVRMRDDQGRYWAGQPEPQGAPDGIHPFLLQVPPELTNVVPEVVLLKPVEAELLVETKNYITP